MKLNHTKKLNNCFTKSFHSKKKVLNAKQNSTKRASYKYCKQSSLKRKDRIVCTVRRKYKKGGNSVQNHFLSKIFGDSRKHKLSKTDIHSMQCISIVQILDKKFFIIITCDDFTNYTMHTRSMPTSMIMGIIQLMPILFKKLIYKIYQICRRKKFGGEIHKDTVKSGAVVAGVGATAASWATMVPFEDEDNTSSNDVSVENMNATQFVEKYYNPELSDNHKGDYNYRFKSDNGQITIHRNHRSDDSIDPDGYIFTHDKLIEDRSFTGTGFSATGKTLSEAEKNKLIRELKSLEDEKGDTIKPKFEKEHEVFEARFEDGNTIYYEEKTIDNSIQLEIVGYRPKYSFPNNTIPEHLTFTDLHEEGLPVEAYSNLSPQPDASALLHAGYTPEELYTAKLNYDSNQVDGNWFTPTNLKEAGVVDVNEMYQAGVPTRDLYELYGENSLTDLKDAGVDVNEMYQAGVPTNKLYELYGEESLKEAGIVTGHQDEETNQLLIAKILAAIGISSVLSQVLAVFFAICGMVFLLHMHDKKTDSSRYITFYRKIIKKLKLQQNIDTLRPKFEKKISQTQFVFEKKLELGFAPSKTSLENHLRECANDDIVQIIGYSERKR